MKQAIFMTVDMGKSMLLPYSENMNRNHLSFECVKLFLQQKIFNANKHHFGLAVFGDDAENGHCYAIHQLAEPKLQVIRQIDQLAQLNHQNKLEGGDIFAALKYTIDSLGDHAQNKKIKKRLFLFTSGEGKTDYNKEDIRTLSEIINQNNVKVNLIAIDFMESYNEETNQIDGVSTLNPIQANNIKHLLKLRQLCPDNMRILPASIAIQLYREFRKKETNRVAVYRGPFQLSPGLSIDIATYTQSRQEKLVSLKKYNNRHEAHSTPADKDLVTVEPVYQVDGDIVDKVVNPQDIINAYRYGNGIVPMTEFIKNEIAIFEDKKMELIGFVEKEHVPRHYFMGNVYKVIPGDNQSSKKLFSAFVYSMLEMEKYALCRHISRNNKNGVSPKLVVLMPFKSSQGQCFYMTQMPTLGQIREYPFNSLYESTPNEQKIVDELIDKMDLMNGENGEQAVKVQNLLNPTKQYLFQSLFYRVANPNDDLPSLDPNIKNYISPQQRITPSTQQLLAEVNKVFGFKKNEINKNDNIRKIVWAQLLKQKQVSIQKSIAATDVQDQLADWKKFDFEPQPITQIDPSRPIESFSFMISYNKKDLVPKAIREMIEFIENKLSAGKSVDHSYNDKLIIDCLSVLRNGCIRQKEELSWDTWLKNNLDNFDGDLKSKLKSNGLGYILESNSDLYKVEAGSVKAVIKIQYQDLD